MKKKNCNLTFLVDHCQPHKLQVDMTSITKPKPKPQINRGKNKQKLKTK